MVVYHVGMSNNTDDFVGFCPHENLTGGNGTNGGDSIMIGGPVKLRFAGKRHTAVQAKILAVKDIAVKGVTVKGVAVKDIAVKDIAVKGVAVKDVAAEEKATEEEVHSPKPNEAIEQPDMLDEDPVVEEETIVTGIIPGPDDTPVAEEPQEEPKPVKKARKTKKKA